MHPAFTGTFLSFALKHLVGEGSRERQQSTNVSPGSTGKEGIIAAVESDWNLGGIPFSLLNVHPCATELGALGFPQFTEVIKYF